MGSIRRRFDLHDVAALPLLEKKSESMQIAAARDITAGRAKKRIPHEK
ncbi:hypothetical protein [Burkholderia oklahomensis]|nr:hypothetical protein [Burkholderia oklahomensis]